MPNIVERLKQRKKMVEDESTLEEDAGLEKAKKMDQEAEGYPSDKEVERPVRKSEGGRYHGMEMPDDYMKDVHDMKRKKK